MDFHAFVYVTIGRRHELERGMAGKDPVLYQRMLDEIAEYARVCDATGWSGIGIPEHHLQVEGFERWPSTRPPSITCSAAASTSLWCAATRRAGSRTTRPSPA
jgi:hypothetical protein